MDELLLLNPALSRDDVESLLGEYCTRRLGEFTEMDEWFSVWEIVNTDKPIFEFEFHWKPIRRIGYLHLRCAPPAHLLNWLNQRNLLASTKAVIELLASANAAMRMSGLTMVALDPQSYFVDRLFDLRNDSDPQVSQFAREIFEQQFQIKPEQLGLPHAHLQASDQDRRQLLRWVMQTPAPATSAITQLINQSLNDSDWEVRVSAMIASARFQLASLAEQVAGVALPGVAVVTKRDLEIFHAIQKIVFFILKGQRPEFRTTGIKQARWLKLYQLVLGELSPTSNPDAVDSLDAIIHYFTTPFPGHQHLPPSDPAVVAVGGKFFLATTSIELCWVPAGIYWYELDSLENKLTYSNLSRGFFISRYHYSLDDDNDDESPIDSLIIKMSALSRTLNVPLSLPTPAQWLSAICGTDARRYAWGWGLQSDWMLQTSPWGLLQPWSDKGEWVSERGEHKVVGVVNQSAHVVSKIDDAASSACLPWRVVYAPQLG